MPRVRNLYLLYGLSDKQYEKVFIDRDGNFRFELSGSPCFLNYISMDKFNVLLEWMYGGDPDYVLSIPAGVPVVNYISDPDSHSIGLDRILQLVNANNLRCFNHPANILSTRRDFIAERLQGIPGIVVPRTIRLIPAEPQDFSTAHSEQGLAYPVILRLAGDHGGVSTIKIDSAADWNKIHQLVWAGRAVYLSEWLDYSDKDQFFRKHRIIMIAGRPFLRHVIIGDQWMLHGENRLARPEFEAEESAHLQRFENETVPKIKAQLDAIYQRIGLDFFGIDCHLAEDGSLTIFEVNATMNCFFAPVAPPHKWQATLAQMLDATEKLLAAYCV